jgi:hypothetical protein
MGRYLETVLASGICPKCQEPKPDLDEQYSYGIYAGVMCRDCAVRSFRDACGHTPAGQGNPADLDEPLDED